MVKTQLLKTSFRWGVVLWLIGYFLGMIFFVLLPPAAIGWVVMPLGLAITVWVLNRKISCHAWREYALVATVWTLLAVVLDYIFVVKAIDPPDGYYKLDVYLYYALTFVLPFVVGWWKDAQSRAHLPAPRSG
jgi:hypothetical protein